jgi:class 3 adenylate cyclase
MEEMCEPDMIQISQTTYEFVSPLYNFDPRGEVSVKGKGPMHAYLTNPSIAGENESRQQEVEALLNLRQLEG